MQLPPLHDCPGAHDMPHEPQFDGSVIVSTQLARHIVMGESHVGPMSIGTGMSSPSAGGSATSGPSMGVTLSLPSTRITSVDTTSFPIDCAVCGSTQALSNAAASRGVETYSSGNRSIDATVSPK
jgi:hypothetical protein